MRYDVETNVDEKTHAWILYTAKAVNLPIREFLRRVLMAARYRSEPQHLGVYHQEDGRARIPETS